MRRLRFGVALILVGAVASLMAGCGGSDPNEAKTPANSPTITNGLVSPNHQRENPTGRAGDAAAGGVLFNRTCQSCHANGGTQAATGPVLAHRGLTAQAIFDQIANGGTVMHSNLVSGVDVDNVTAYVLSLQAGGTAATPAPAATTATTPPASGGGGGDTAAIAAGKTFFEGTCQACHTAGGTQAGVGPKLAGLGLTADRINHQVVNGGVVMPPGLASGIDLQNVTKYLLSLQ